MPNATHVRLANTAKRLIKKHGRPLQLVSETRVGPTYNPIITNANASVEVVGVQTKFAANEVDGDLVLVTDKLYLLDSEVEPHVDMKLRDGVNHSIVSVATIQPGETGIIYKVHCRQ